MTQKEEQALWKQIQSKRVDVKRSALRNPNCTDEMIASILSGHDSRVKREAAKHWNIGQKSFEAMRDEGGLDKDTFMYFLQNAEFKKEWVIEYIGAAAENNFDLVVMSALETPNIDYTADEWVVAYSKALSSLKNYPIDLDANWATFWYAFFQYPNKNYDKKIIMMLLDRQGKMLYRQNKKVFDAILKTQTQVDDEVRMKMFDMSEDVEYLTDEMKELFVF